MYLITLQSTKLVCKFSLHDFKTEFKLGNPREKTDGMKDETKTQRQRRRRQASKLEKESSEIKER